MAPIHIFDSESANRYACTECKRRRIRCSRNLPVCSTCERTKRHCLYEESKRLPLTRRHMTEVEEELALLKKLHRTLMPDVDYRPLLLKLKNGGDISSLDWVKPQEHNEQSQRSQNRKSQDLELESMTGSESLRFPELSSFDYSKQIPQVFPPTLVKTGEAQKPTADSPLSSVSKSNNQWDERSNTQDGRSPFMINGMATVDSDIFLGVTSSAALINLVGGEYFLHEAAQINETIPKNPKTVIVPDRSLLELYIGSYFDTYHVLYPIVNRPLFLAQFNEIIEAPPHFQSLLYIVAAIGSFMSAETHARCDDLELFQISKSFLSIDDFETGNLTLVQILALMLNYLQKRDKPNLGYNYLGLAVRMAMGLGLHKNAAHAELTLFTRELRKRIWWCLYIFDVGQTITYGRPLGSPCAGIDTELLLNVADSNLTSNSVEWPKEERTPTVYTLVLLQLQFHILTNSIYERLISDPFPTAEELLNWDTQYIQKWKQKVPDFYNETAQVTSQYMLAHSVLHWRYRNFRILMYRTFALKARNHETGDQKNSQTSQFEEQAKSICLSECRATIQSISDFWEKKKLHNRMDTWYSLYFLIPAVVMPLICLRNSPDLAELGNWVSDILALEQLVEKLKVICPAATRISDLIFSVGRDYLPYRDTARDFPELSMEESPMSQLIQLHLMLKPGFFD